MPERFASGASITFRETVFLTVASEQVRLGHDLAGHGGDLVVICRMNASPTFQRINANMASLDSALSSWTSPEAAVCRHFPRAAGASGAAFGGPPLHKCRNGSRWRQSARRDGGPRCRVCCHSGGGGWDGGRGPHLAAAHSAHQGVAGPGAQGPGRRWGHTLLACSKLGSSGEQVTGLQTVCHWLADDAATAGSWGWEPWPAVLHWKLAHSRFLCALAGGPPCGGARCRRLSAHPG